MITKTRFNFFQLLLFITVFLSYSCVANAASATITLVQDSLTNVDDAAGRWQHEGGRVLFDSEQIGYYAAHRRVTDAGTTPMNTAMLTITLFIPGRLNAPDNVTIQGSHDFISGEYIGSVSAASSIYSFLIGADIKGNTVANTMTITW